MTEAEKARKRTKKLEAKGFKCELDYNELKIDWN